MVSGIAENPEKFGNVTKHMWYNMPSSVLPIGLLSEDTRESRNKDYKSIRLHHARKCSRSAMNEDVLFHGLLFTSDPYISSIRKASITVSKELLDEAKNLLDI